LFLAVSLSRRHKKRLQNSLTRFSENSTGYQGVMVELTLAEKIQNRPRGTGFGIWRTKNHSSEATMKYCTTTHGARLQGDKQLSTTQSMTANGLRGFPQREYLCMGTRVVQLSSSIPSTANNLSFANNYGTHRNFTGRLC
jgi:hypothetical protein